MDEGVTVDDLRRALERAEARPLPGWVYPTGWKVYVLPMHPDAAAWLLEGETPRERWKREWRARRHARSVREGRIHPV